MQIAKKQIFLSLIVIALGLIYVHPVYDTDFWWHLKTGEWIWINKAIPGNDIFSFTTYLGAYSLHLDRIRYILSQYWLSQPLFFLAWNFFGPEGVIALRVLILLAAVSAVYLFLLKEKIRLPVAVSLTLIAGLHLTFFSAEKPQLFSFLFSVLYLYEIEHLIKGGRRPLFSLPLLAIVWANMHSSALLAWAIGGVYFLNGTISWIRHPGEKRKYQLALAVIAASLALTFLNPNTYHVFQLVAKTEVSYVTSMNNEYLSPVTKFRAGFLYPSYWFLVLFSLAAFFNKRAFSPRNLLLLFLLALSLKSIRYTPFFVLLSPMLSAADFEEMLKKAPKGIVVPIGTALALTFFTLYQFRGDLCRTGTSEDDYPAEAVRFIRERNIKGKAFNFFEWGGYLEWQLPSSKTFIDSRVLRHDFFARYIDLLHASSPGRIDTLEGYDVDFFILPGVSPATGEPFGIVHSLINHPEWKAVYADRLSLIFVRRDFPAREIPSARIYDQRITALREWVQKYPGNDLRWRRLGNAYFMANDRTNAAFCYRNAARVNPEDTYSMNMLRLLETHRGR